jgi:hypothetical protein
MHQDPHVSNTGRPGRGYKLRPGLVLALEPWVMADTAELVTDADGWTLRSATGCRTAHSEHTIAITNDGAEILTLPKQAQPWGRSSRVPLSEHCVATLREQSTWSGHSAQISSSTTQRPTVNAGQRFDLILDTVGNRSVSGSSTRDRRERQGSRHGVHKGGLLSVSLRGGKGIAKLSAHVTSDDLALLARLIDGGKVHPQIIRR